MRGVQAEVFEVDGKKHVLPQFQSQERNFFVKNIEISCHSPRLITVKDRSHSWY